MVKCPIFTCGWSKKGESKELLRQAEWAHWVESHQSRED